MAKRLLLLGIVVALLTAACGEAGEPASDTAPGGGTASAVDAEAISFGSSLAQIRGHHAVALELYRDGDRDAALVHAAHPIEEILTSVTSELEEHETAVGEELSTALEDARAAVEGGGSVDDVAAAFERAAAATEDAEAAVVTIPDDSSYQGSVIAALLATAAHEYEEAVAGGGGKIKLLVEYQDGYGFVTEARSLYDAIASDVEAASAEEAEEIEAAFDTLNRALPGPTPPAKLASALDVESAAELIGHELEETVDAELQDAADPADVAEEIEKLLDEVVAAYEAGDEERAAELAAEAYLENYEVIEAEVIEQAPDVNAELEPLLGAELRKRIQEGAPVSEIRSMVERSKELLADALEALEHAE